MQFSENTQRSGCHPWLNGKLLRLAQGEVTAQRANLQMVVDKLLMCKLAFFPLNECSPGPFINSSNRMMYKAEV